MAKDTTRETMTLYVTGNGSDSAGVQEVLNELACFSDEALNEAEDHLESLIDLLDTREIGEGEDWEDQPPPENAELLDVLDKLVELLSEITLYNSVQRLDPITSAMVSRSLGI